jgi:opacity protein-like surface antigen
VLACCHPAHAQDGFGLRGFADVGSRTFTATDSFTAILGSDRGVVFGGGVEAVLPGRVFVSVRASRFRETGERVFIFNGEQFDLGIPTTITVTPVELTGGYRFDFGRRLIPYAGAGVGWHKYTETSQFAEESETVDARHTGFQLLGGAEFGFARWIAAAAELQWATVPDALGEDPNGVAAEFDETDLGGLTFRVKIVIGR